MQRLSQSRERKESSWEDRIERKKGSGTSFVPTEKPEESVRVFQQHIHPHVPKFGNNLVELIKVAKQNCLILRKGTWVVNK